MKILLLLLVTILSTQALAGSFSYSCTVNGEYVFGSNGELISDNRAYFGQTFNVERKSGVVLGEAIGNSSYPTKTVIDVGSQEQSYKLLWVSKEVIGSNNGRNAVYLNIEEFNQSASKPFSMVVGSRVVSGVCK